MRIKNRQEIILLVLILSLAFFLRITLLNQVPPGIANDEINLIINAQSILKTGQNIPGVVTGIFGNSTGDLSGGIHSEISSLLLVPFIFVFGFSWPIVKIPFILASIGILYISYLLVKKLVSNQAGLMAAFLSAINPWTIHFGRSAYESILSAFFYLLGIYLVIILKQWKILWALPILLMGFLSYFSAKTLLLPLALLLIPIVKFLKPKESLKPVIFLNVFIFVFLIFYGLMLLDNPAGLRVNELENQNIKSLVDSKHTASLHLPFARVFENKFTEDLRIRLRASLGGLSPKLIFLDGQPESIPSLSIPDHAPLYLVDLPLIVFGLVFLARFNQRILYIFLSLIGITLIPNFLNLAGTTYMIRTVILFPILTMISALGIYYLFKNLPKNIFKTTLFIFLSLIYFYLFGNFIYQYFSRLPVVRNEGWFLHQRIISKYIKSSMDENLNVYFVTQEPKHSFYRYLFFTGNYTENPKIKAINENLTEADYTLGNLTSTSRCPENYDQENTTYIIDVRSDCPKVEDVLSISDIKDGGEKYMVINDSFCKGLVNRRYPLIKDIQTLNIESLEREDFCNQFITNFDAD